MLLLLLLLLLLLQDVDDGTHTDKEDKEDKEEDKDESFSAEEQLFSYASFLLSFLYSFFGVLERGLC